MKLKYIVTILVLLMILTGCTSKTKAKTGWDEFKVNGRVKILKTMYEPYESDDPVLESTIVEFDSEGNVKSHAAISTSGNTMSETYYKYSEEGKLISVTDEDKIHKTESTTLINYNDQGLESERLYYGANGVLYEKATTEYDDKNRVVKISRVGPDNKVISDKQFTYENNKLVGEISNNYQVGWERLRYSYDYERSGNLVRKISVDKYGNETNESLEEYDQYGNLILSKTIFSAYKFETYFENKYELEYDKYGNWTQLREISEDAYGLFIVRSIEYH